MVKQFVAIASILAGIAAAGLVAYIQVDRTALTTPAEPSKVLDTEVVPAARVEVGPAGETVFEPSRITVDPVDIVVPVPPIKKPTLNAPNPQPEIPLATEPCSDWRELGPKATDTLKGEMHRVRLLCVS